MNYKAGPLKKKYKNPMYFNKNPKLDYNFYKVNKTILIFVKLKTATTHKLSLCPIAVNIQSIKYYIMKFSYYKAFLL